MFVEISNCRICGGAELESIFEVGDQALTGVFPGNKTTKVTSGPVELVKCMSGCGLVQLRQSYDVSEMYGLNYGYRTGLNASMVRHITGKMHKIVEMGVLQDGDLVIDIGSNDATGLRAYPQERFTLVGVDPTGVKFEGYYPETVALIPDFFSAEVVNNRFPGRKARVITSFSMFYDLEQPIEFAKQVAETLEDDGIWVFEQSYLPAMLETNSFDTICHEHLEFYALEQIQYICEAAGLMVLDVEFNDVNGGSFSIVASKKGSGREINHNLIDETLRKEEALGISNLACYEEFRTRVAGAKEELNEFLRTAKEEGKTVCGLGASTKGNVLLQYYGISEDLLPKIGDVNSDKFGCFTPGSLIPIESEDAVLESNPDYLLVLPWHFRKFFLNLDKMKGRTLVFPLPQLEVVRL